MKQDFIDYIQDTFNFKAKEMKEFEASLGRPLKKSLRVNTNKISIKDFKKLAKENGWTLSPTPLGKNMFYIDREDTSIALGNTLEHINGYFYIQEVSASSSPYFLSNDTVDTNPYLILDMSASPGWKTTELSEYYPNSLIIANEIDKWRLKSLFLNLDRMWALGVVATNYDGRFFKQTWELFDKVLLDAPCSGEWTSFKTDDALKYWNVKNIKRIAKLQFGLLEAAVKSTKVGWEIIYSTCTLNTIENEQIVEKIMKKYWDFVKIVPVSRKNKFQRNWPHKDKTWGFFVAKFEKITSLEQDPNDLPYVKQGFEKVPSKNIKLIENYFEEKFNFDLTSFNFYTYRDEVYITNKNLDSLGERFFFFNIWVKIGAFKNNEFQLSFYAGTLSLFKKWTIEVSPKELDSLLKGESIGSDLTDGYYQAIIKNHPAGICKVKNGKLESLVESSFIRW